MSDMSNALAVTLFSEILAADALVRSRLGKVFPKGMEISHFSVLNQLDHSGAERTPAQLAKAFHVTRGAMTNTLRRLEIAGYVHIRPDWEDARRKQVTISPAGRQARAEAVAAMTPLLESIVEEIGDQKLRAVLPILRDLRVMLERDD